MLHRDDPLWPKLRDFPLDDAASSLPFTRRLARENLWTLAYALRVTQEYRRFLFLAMRAGHMVTPSEEVDQAWHLHLIYTRSYWDELCGEVLGRPLHHGPTRGGGQEQDKYHDLYGRTLESYARWFGRSAPPEIWPPHETRFQTPPVTVKRQDFWLIPKPWRRKR